MAANGMTTDATPQVARVAKIGAVACLVAGVAALLIAVVVVTLVVVADRSGLSVEDLVWMVAWTGVGALGAFVAARRPRNPVGWLFLAAGALVATAVMVDVASLSLLAKSGADRTGVLLRWVQNLMFVPALVCALPLGLLLFPTGSPPTRRWRWVIPVAVTAAVLSIVEAGVRPGPIGDGSVPVDNPFAWRSGAAVVSVVGTVWRTLLLLAAVAAVGSVVARYRRATVLERRQLLWLVWAVSVGVILEAAGAAYDAVAGLPEGAGALLSATVVVLLPTAATIAIVRHHLYDVELLVRRSLVFVALSGLVAVAYVAVVLLFAVAGGDSPASGLVATLVAACIAVPAYHRIGRVVDRRLFGDRADPYRALAALGSQLGRASDARSGLAEVAVATAASLRAPYVAIEGLDVRPLAATGTRSGGPALVVDLAHQGKPVGRLVVAWRTRADPYSVADLRLLTDLAPQVGAAIALLQLTDDVQRAREYLVLGREDERRRLRRDLHDGIGPTLAGATLRVALARDAVSTDAERARALLSDAEEQLEATVRQVRELVYGLRPPALDDLGLVGALRERVATLDPSETIRVQVDEPLPTLPAAVEAAAYRIVVEAVTNTLRHSRARTGVISLRCQSDGGRDGLLVSVADDGVGLDGTAPGVGIRSMTERAEELGGQVTVDASRTGTTVHAWLPR
ncbi:GAF domain-containing sensor histidine kinase [Micromonospora sp. DT47]|uniref:sensor histidine kinase n=1 Tax=Micromonospora sp. DT47 TaxID=3393431 RepID=UPI003CEBE467